MLIPMLLLASSATGTVITLEQVGAVSPPGAPSSLRCIWTADLGGGERSEGSRVGWCRQARAAIEREIAARRNRSDRRR